MFWQFKAVFFRFCFLFLFFLSFTSKKKKLLFWGKFCVLFWPDGKKEHNVCFVFFLFFFFFKYVLNFVFPAILSNRDFYRNVPFRSRALYKLFAGAQSPEISKIFFAPKRSLQFITVVLSVSQSGCECVCMCLGLYCVYV